jgi:hypothetical protein
MSRKWLNGHRPKLINGKVWVPEGDNSFRKLPEDDPDYFDTLLWIDNRRFVELLDWVYHKRNKK